MPKFISYLEQARRDAELIEQRCRKARGASLTPTGLMAGGAALSRLDSQSRSRVRDGREQQLHYRGQSFISIRPIAQRIAGQPIRLARIGRAKAKARRAVEPRHCETPEWVKAWATRSSRAGDWEVLDQHPILDVLHRSAPSVPGWNDWMLKCFTVVNLEITGYAYWWLVRVGGKQEIWPLPSHWVRPVSDERGLFVQWAIKPDGGEEQLIPREEIAPFWYPDPANPFRGLGPLEAGAREILVNEFVVEAQKRSFQLGVHPCAVVKLGSVKLDNGRTVQARARQHQIEQVVQAINARYRGMTHFGEPMVIDRMIESITPYGNEPQKMDFGSNAGSAQARVEQVFGTNAYIAGASGLGSRAEAAVADANFCYLTVNPKIELLSRVMTMCVLPQFDSSGRYALFIEPARPNDAEMAQQEWEQGQKYCAVEINEYRTNVLRLPPVPWGDAVAVPNEYSIVPVAQLNGGHVQTTAPGPQTATASRSTETSRRREDFRHDAPARPPARQDGPSAEDAAAEGAG
jgi:hypothetical protein